MNIESCLVCGSEHRSVATQLVASRGAVVCLDLAKARTRHEKLRVKVLKARIRRERRQQRRATWWHA